MSLESENIYRLAYKTHYERNELEEAYKLCLTVIKEYPETNEAKYARQQIANLKKVFDLDSAELNPDLRLVKQEIETREAEVEEQNAKKKEEYRAEYNKRIMRQKSKETMLLSTCSSLEGFRIIDHRGLVFGECVFKTGLFKQVVASLEDAVNILSFGDQELSGITEIFDNAREYAIGKMVDSAVSKGANAIVGIDSESSMGGGILHITIYGTAVKVERITSLEKEADFE